MKHKAAAGGNLHHAGEVRAKTAMARASGRPPLDEPAAWFDSTRRTREPLG
jgi:hypothetical protein